MSDTLLEPEDQATADYCNECKGRPHAPWCSEYEEPDSVPPKLSLTDDYEGVANEHEPAARGGGGGEEWRVVEIGRNTYIERDSDDPFICDMQTNDSSDAERKEARQLANQIVDEHRQHQSLVAERRHFSRLVEAVKAMRLRHRETAKKSNFGDCGCDDCLLLQPILTAIEHYEQRSTSA